MLRGPENHYENVTEGIFTHVDDSFPATKGHLHNTSTTLMSGFEALLLPVQLRDLYWTFRNFRNRVIDFLRYRRVTANMDERFSNATEEDLARCDGICIICREEMVATGRNKKLPCSHVFHTHCLRSAAVPEPDSFCA